MSNDTRELTVDVLDQVAGGAFRRFGGLGGQDRMGNFEIQNLMSTYNQAETLASSVQRKSDEMAAASIGKI